MIGVVTRGMLPHLSGVPHLHVKRHLDPVCVLQSVKTKETNPTRPGSPTPCKQALTLVMIPQGMQKYIDEKCLYFSSFFCFLTSMLALVAFASSSTF